MKRMLALHVMPVALIGFLLIGSAGPQFATAAMVATQPSLKGDITAQQADAIAAKLLPIPAGYIMMNTNYQSNFLAMSGPVYVVSFAQPMATGSAFQNQVTASIDASTGEVLSFQYMGSSRYAGTGPTLSASQEQARAQQWLDKINPHHSLLTLFHSAGRQAPSLPGEQSFTYVREVGGIPLAFQVANVVLDQSGNLNLYQSDFKDVALPSVTSHVTLSTANSAYIRALNLYPAYEPLMDVNGATASKTILSYISNWQSASFEYGAGFNISQPWINAATGQAIDTSGHTVVAKPISYPPIIPGGPAKLPQAHSTLMTSKQMLQIASKVVPATFVMQSAQQSNVGNASTGGAPFLEQFNFTNPKSMQQAFVSVDPRYGIVTNLSFNSTIPTAASQAPATEAHPLAPVKITETANAFIQSMLPNLTGGLALQPISSDVGMTSGIADRSYVLLIQGLEDTADTVNVGVDSYTGQVVQYYANFTDLNHALPSPKGIISAKEAANDYLKQNPLQLVYVLPIVKDNLSQPNGTVVFAKMAQLVYTPPNVTSDVLNALTGRWVTLPGLSQPGVVPSDIKGHRGEQAMLTLLNDGALPVVDGKVQPDRDITRAQFVDILIHAQGNYFGNSPQETFKDVPVSSAYYSSIEQAITQGIISFGKYFYPNGFLTRNEAASMLVNLLGNGTIAKQGGLFKLPFVDASSIPAAYRGDAAIAAYDDIFPAIQGKWDGSAHVSIATAAIAIVRALQLHATN